MRIMRRHGPQVFLVLLCAMLASPAAAQQVGIQWQQDLEAAKKLARETNRMVLVHFWTPSCAPCLTLDHTVFNQPNVAVAIEQQFVPVKLNANENSATAQGFGITRVPTDVILTPDGHVIGKLISPPTPAGYVAEVTQVAAAYAATPGQPFTNAAVNAPLPKQLNAAYASLQVSPSARAALDQPAMSPTPEPTQTAFGSGPAAGVSSGVPVGQVNNPFLAAGGTGASASPVTTPATPITNRYAAIGDVGVSAPPLALSAPTGAAPPQAVTNPYFSAPAVAVPQPGPQTAASILTPAFPQPAEPQVMANVPQQPVTSTIAPASSVAATPQLPAGAPPLGFDGYCPVSMRNNWKWVAGDPRWGVIHRGRTYWFAGEAEQKQFWTDPDRYSPALSGMDPVMAIDHKQQVPGKREHSIDYDNLFYMFSSEATLAQFTANPERYAVGVRQAMGIPRGRLVR
jgi:protein disulfide-isomerase